MMKKYTITLIASVAALTAFGQGTVNFSTPNGVYVTNSSTQARVVTGSAFKAVLYYLPDSAATPTTADFDSGEVLGAAANFGPLAGAFVGGTRTAPTAAPGGLGWFQVRAWETAFGADYATASRVAGALVGTSNIFKVDTADPTTTPAGTATLLTGLLQSFVLYPVPEPSVIGLGILGLGALLMLRRRK
jgi:hypothetical protein